MKKPVLIIFVLTALVAGFICGCNNDSAAQKQRIDELEEKVAELEKENERLWEMLYGSGFQDGEFYTLQQAYDYQWLSQDDLKSIAYYHNGGTEGNEEIMGADFQPKPKTPEALDIMTELSIKQTYCNNLQAENNAKPSGVTIKRYYGEYNGCYAVVLDSKYVFYPADVVNKWEMIEGIGIHYTDYFSIYLWKVKGD